MRSCNSEFKYQLRGFSNEPRDKSYLGGLELDVELVVHERLEAVVVLVTVLLLLLGLDLAQRRLVREVARDGDVTGVEYDVLAVLLAHVLGDDDDRLRAHKSKSAPRPLQRRNLNAQR